MLDEYQKQAVDHFRGPCLVIAGPGSGKTTVLTHRIAALIREHGIAPERILVITFTRDAAYEMQNRFLALAGAEGVHVAFGTFHSIFYKVLRDEGRYAAGAVLSGRGRMNLMREIASDCGVRRLDDASLQKLAMEISSITNRSIEPEHFTSRILDDDEMQRFYRSYQRAKQEAHLLDFDDMLGISLTMFRENPDVLRRWQERFEMILVDEAQDMNRIQFELLMMLAGEHRNLFMVGDDDQSIYGFRGAEPGLLLNIRSTLPDCRLIRLSVNYRSCDRIVGKAACLIGHNQKRFDKKLAGHGAPGGSVILRRADNPAQEAQQIAWAIRRRLDAGGKMTCAVLFRNHTQAHEITRQLIAQHIPFYMREKMTPIYDHWIMRDICAYLSITCGGGTREDYLRAANRPNRYLKRESMDAENVSFAVIRRYYAGNPRILRRVDQMEDHLRRMAHMTCFAAINYLLHAVGYETYLRSTQRTGRDADEEWKPIVESILSIAREQPGHGPQAMRGFLDAVSRMRDEADAAKKKAAPGTGVGLYTFHGSKGLEFDQVYILDANEHITPSRQAHSDDAVEEERRMFYVAMTRAKTSLIIYCVKERGSEKLAPSRFLAELSDDST